ncbi:Major facilitator superfamily domain-containing protein 4B [Halotydeus destructor]|nr:Major facilitator superfamily domain-containing protein 4B [Halotydeus destructor]
MGVLEEIRKDNLRFRKTLAIYFAFLCVGLYNSVLASTLTDFQLQTGSDYTSITYLLTGQALGMLVGSVIIGLIFEKVNILLTMAIALLATAILSFTASLMTNITWLIFLNFMSYVSLGAIETGGIMFTIHMWGKICTPFLNGLYSLFGLGSFLAPLVTVPFLLPIQDDGQITPDAKKEEERRILSRYDPVGWIWLIATRRLENLLQHGLQAKDVKIYYVYAMMSTLSVMSAIVFVHFFVHHAETTGHPSREELSLTPGQPMSSRRLLAAITVTNLAVMSYAGLDIVFGEMSASYAVKGEFQLSTSMGARIGATYWLTFTLGRILAVFYDGVVGRLKMMAICLSLTLLANDILVPYGDTYEACLIVGVATGGLGLAALYATIIGYLEDQFSLTNAMTASIGIANAMGQVVLSVVVGKYLEDDPEVFLYSILVCTSLLCFTLILIAVICEDNDNSKPTQLHTD